MGHQRNKKINVIQRQIYKQMIKEKDQLVKTEKLKKISLKISK